MFTDRFVEILQSTGISAYRVAKDLDISQGTMNQYKNGKTLPNLENVLKIADYLNVSVDYLLGRTDNPKVNK